MLYYFLFEVCPCFLFFLVGGLIIHLLSIMFKSVIDSLGEARLENIRENLKIKAEESLAKEVKKRKEYGIDDWPILGEEE